MTNSLKRLNVALAAGAAAAFVMLAGASAHAANLISDGNFANPNQSGGWSDVTGTGWTSNDPSTTGIEIGYSPIYGLSCVSGPVCQNMEVNANAFDTVSYTVTGLTVGDSYDLSYQYGGRTSGGPDALDVSFGGDHLARDTGSVGFWTLNNYIVTATATSETLVLSSEDLGGLPSYGNEITNVSLSAVPEPATWAMMLLGIGVIGAGLRMGRQQRATVSAA